MAIFMSSSNISFERHPKYHGVMIAILAGKADGQGIGTSVLEVAPGVEIPVHTHANEADSIYVLSGKGHAYVDGKWREIREGDYVLVPKGEEHGVKNTGDTPLRLFIVHCPPLF